MKKCLIITAIAAAAIISGVTGVTCHKDYARTVTIALANIEALTNDENPGWEPVYHNHVDYIDHGSFIRVIRTTVTDCKENGYSKTCLPGTETVIMDRPIN